MSGLSGHCHCGQCTYSVEHEGTFHFCCLCEGCQRLSAGGRLLGINVPSETFQASGPLREYTYPGGSGEPIVLSFCEVCSTQLFARPTHHPGAVILRATSLNQELSFKPRKFIFREAAPAWDMQALHE